MKLKTVNLIYHHKFTNKNAILNLGLGLNNKCNCSNMIKGEWRIQYEVGLKILIKLGAYADTGAFLHDYSNVPPNMYKFSFIINVYA